MSQLKKMLIVDDERYLVEVIADLFRDFETHWAFDGKEGFDKAKSIDPDVIISDIKMPKMDGLQLLEALKKDGSKCPFIIATGFSDTIKIQTAWKLGAFDFFEKPINFALLKSIVKNAIEFGNSPSDHFRSRFEKLK